MRVAWRELAVPLSSVNSFAITVNDGPEPCVHWSPAAMMGEGMAHPLPLQMLGVYIERPITARKLSKAKSITIYFVVNI